MSNEANSSRKIGRISVWKQDKPATGRPELTGSVEIEGREYRVSLWSGDGKAGSPVFKGQIELPGPGSANRRAATAAPAPATAAPAKQKSRQW